MRYLHAVDGVPGWRKVGSGTALGRTLRMQERRAPGTEGRPIKWRDEAVEYMSSRAKGHQGGHQGDVLSTRGSGSPARDGDCTRRQVLVTQYSLTATRSDHNCAATTEALGKVYLDT